MKGLDEDECSVKPVPFTVQYIKCVFFPSVLFYCLWFFLSQQGWAFMFWGRCLCQGGVGPSNWSTLCLSYVSSLLTLISPSFWPRFFFPAHSFIVFIPFLFSSSPPDFHPFSWCFFCIYSFFLFPCPCLKGPLGALWFVCWKAYQHHRRHHWNLALFSLPRSLTFPLSPFYIFFSSSLFNVEVLSNC